MANKKKLKLTKQCKLCPFKVCVDPYDIPNYKRDQHVRLVHTIAEQGNPIEFFQRFQKSRQIRMMACHGSTEKKSLLVLAGFIINWDREITFPYVFI